ncbi:GNAT family N-acetyltransferase [Bifidobacterium choerinum]|uniref:N-acetyltransferase domain-containing protein n=1 Tax=Bifidobacterium choerinum TaxID=35760 RepID=A0A2D3D6L9_9BIFI|nr:GNAT family N-acetyltransferase [Bifidobacterium choerinum]ATU20580.1 hypothetical protein BcFMB_06235 [Bifidobacterium choerinum]
MTFERIKNLLRRWSERHVPDATVRIVIARDDMEAQMIWGLPAEQIEHGWDQRIEYPGADTHDLFRPTLIGAWAGDDLIGGAFVMPDEQDAESYRPGAGDHGAQTVERYRVMIQGIATLPQHRAEDVGTQLKYFCEQWAREHDALLISGIPTTDQAYALNRRCGYHVLEPLVPLIMQPHDAHTGLTPMPIPFDDTIPGSRWAFKTLGHSASASFRIGQFDDTQIPGRSDDQRIHIHWIADTFPTGHQSRLNRAMHGRPPFP